MVSKGKRIRHSDLFGIGKNNGPDAYDLCQNEIRAFLDFYKQMGAQFKKLKGVKSMINSHDCNDLIVAIGVIRGLCDRMTKVASLMLRKLIVAGL